MFIQLIDGGKLTCRFNDKLRADFFPEAFVEHIKGLKLSQSYNIRSKLVQSDVSLHVKTRNGSFSTEFRHENEIP